MALSQKKRGQAAEVPSALSADETKGSMRTVPQWTLCEHSIFRELSFKDFIQAMDFVNQVAQISEAEDHHPDIFISYNKVKLDLSTHTARGLTQKDFDLAEKIDRFFEANIRNPL